MSRIRSVHPGLFTDEAFVSLTPAAQIFWIGLWCEADDQGVFEWKPLTLKMRVLPAAEGSVTSLLDELSKADCIQAFVHDDKPYGVIRNFARHQRPKSPKDVHPLPEALRNYAGFNADGSRPDATTGRKRFASGSETVRNEFGTDSECGSQMEDEGEGEGEGGEEKEKQIAAGAAGKRGKTYFFQAGIIKLVEKDFRDWQSRFTNLNIMAELPTLRRWAESEAKAGNSWFFAVEGALNKRNRDVGLEHKRIEAEALANANKPVVHPGWVP